jgi:hypothetical protein
MENVMSHKITKAATAQIDESVQTDAAPAKPQPLTTPDRTTTGNAPAVVDAGWRRLLKPVPQPASLAPRSLSSSRRPAFRPSMAVSRCPCNDPCT